jgi:thiosulfate reductase / polysulfide reductase chain A
VVHGFGHRLPVESRAYMRGLADNKFMKNGLGVWDPVGGAVALQEHFAKVAKEMRGLTLQRGISILHRE